MKIVKNGRNRKKSDVILAKIHKKTIKVYESEEVRGKRKMQIYVDGNAVRSGNGQKEYPFRTISEAAKIARPGDEVLVAPGVYREYVDPANAGCEDARIVYRSVEPGKAVITGAEIVDNWEHLEGDVWTARVSNGLFGGLQSIYDTGQR